ncbi:MAG: cation transporter [Eubacteriales bacterium]|jgi:copper chaperone CopZ|nr:cation transporter [Eubacteriales bacterium]MCI6029133.1 cation transporter [Clostridiales bacterium]
MIKKFRIDGLDCANCAAKIENKISKLNGVRSASLSFMTGKLVLEADDGVMDEIVEKAKAIINRIESGAAVKEV